ncbi:RNB domain-containing ribonuclease [Microbacterium karelineae]|uniref:RNB domain-containing ribonuclease n=1 Tax=Microbacterium karelineae TaxID=2654283 RepID=UPI0012E9FE66|nr:RNB domain-containing ribonuclease [Microbacterium karelineae]
MTARSARLSPSAAALAESFAALRAEIGVPDAYPPEAVGEAERVVAASEAVDGSDAARVDLGDLPFHTIDPEGSRDLDQAMHLSRDGDGFVVRYAIADLAAFVAPGGALDRETRERGQTLYAPDGSTGLHPDPIAHDGASLLPDERRRAYVWRFALAADGRVAETALERAWVRSVRRWTYDEAQAAIDDGSAPDEIALLAEIGPLRVGLEAARGGASLSVPEEEVLEEDGRYVLRARISLDVEEWNAQVSLMTGMQAARLMLDAGVGILRTMPRPEDDAIAEFRRRARMLGRPWGEGVDYGAYLRGLDRADPVTSAIMHAATALFRGAGYAAFDGEPPEEIEQAAIGAPYAHATAPLRRLVDRYVLAICEAEANGRDVPGWARDALEELPPIMQRTGTLAGRLENGCVDRVEAAVLSSRIGDAFDAVAVARTGGGTRVQIADPFVTATVPGSAELGTVIRVRVEKADIARGAIDLVRV